MKPLAFKEQLSPVVGRKTFRVLWAWPLQCLKHVPWTTDPSRNQFWKDASTVRLLVTLEMPSFWKSSTTLLQWRRIGMRQRIVNGVEFWFAMAMLSTYCICNETKCLTGSKRLHSAFGEDDSSVGCEKWECLVNRLMAPRGLIETVETMLYN